ncbi:unnamed protein product [Allacma fusca]|uniref:Uncharacterized protein n=1 Tax=Allacma fusca TaxID=39272 RepID=A0A8J2JLC5_9HEXA|nr:unnamed protein product [Allacma fusca]
MQNELKLWKGPIVLNGRAYYREWDPLPACVTLCKEDQDQGVLICIGTNVEYGILSRTKECVRKGGSGNERRVRGWTLEPNGSLSEICKSWTYGVRI